MTSEKDPLDDLLERAFAADAARTPAVNVADRVVKRLRTRQRLRLMVLTVAAVTGTGLLVVSVPPIVAPLLTALQSGLPADWQSNSLMLTLVTAAAAVWLTMMDEGPA